MRAALRRGRAHRRRATVASVGAHDAATVEPSAQSALARGDLLHGDRVQAMRDTVAAPAPDAAIIAERAAGGHPADVVEADDRRRHAVGGADQVTPRIDVAPAHE